MKRVLNTHVSLCTCVLAVWLPSVGGAQTTYPAPACDPGKITERVGGYQFDSDLDAKFANHQDWQDHPTPGVINDASFYQRNGRLEFEVLSASQAASEAWKTWRVQLSSKKTWKIAADVVVPLSWNHGSSDEHQIGAGLVVGKPGAFVVIWRPAGAEPSAVPKPLAGGGTAVGPRRTDKGASPSGPPN